uniref:Uncharacterized protein n=1 Tax=Panagrolaimus sp. JU765 TaxID=591449 RepID=A0AC34RT46_9BILA
MKGFVNENNEFLDAEIYFEDFQEVSAKFSLFDYHTTGPAVVSNVTILDSVDMNVEVEHPGHHNLLELEIWQEDYEVLEKSFNKRSLIKDATNEKISAELDAADEDFILVDVASAIESVRFLYEFS